MDWGNRPLTICTTDLYYPTLVWKEDGKPEALEGKHDDRLIAAAGLFQIIKEHPYVEKIKINRR